MKIKLIAVDDEKFNLLLLTEALKDEGIEIDTSSSADEAISLIKKNDYDIALLDIIMPGIDGFEMRKVIRETRPKLPIIYLTALVDTIDSDLVERISEDKFTYYIKKPFNRDELIKMINNSVEKKRAEEETYQMYSGMVEDLTLASEVQRLLVPDWLTIEDKVTISSVYAPSQKVSGDIFDIIKLASGKYFVFIGDISGHGVQAALYMSAVQSVLKMIIGYGQAQEVKPHEVLNRLNWIFCTELAQGNYMTCIIGIFDFDNNCVDFFNAGHPNMVEFNAVTESIKILHDTDKGGIPIGWDRNYEYLEEDTMRLKFSDDSVFFLCTDGAFEVSDNNGRMLGLEKLVSVMESIAQSKDPVVVPYLTREALDQMGYVKRPDDMCIISVSQQHIPVSGVTRLSRLIPPMMSEVDKLCQLGERFVMENMGDIKVAVKVELLIGEFLNNIIMHGLDNNQQARPGIFVQLDVHENEVVLKVLDKGKKWAFSTSTTTLSEDIWEKNDQYATAGRGMQIIRSIAAEISRNRYSGLNETVFRIRKEENETDA